MPPLSLLALLVGGGSRGASAPCSTQHDEGGVERRSGIARLCVGHRVPPLAACAIGREFRFDSVCGCAPARLGSFDGGFNLELFVSRSSHVGRTLGAPSSALRAKQARQARRHVSHHLGLPQGLGILRGASGWPRLLAETAGAPLECARRRCAPLSPTPCQPASTCCFLCWPL